MLGFNTLPVLVKRRIIGIAARCTAIPAEKHILLSVSHQWRDMAMSVIFKIVILQSPTSSAYATLPYNYRTFAKEILSGENSLEATPMPTAALAILANATKYVKVLVINFGDHSQYHQVIAALPDTLHCGKCSWQSVCSLLILDMDFAITPQTSDGFDYSQIIANINQFKRVEDAVYDMFPHVRNIDTYLRNALSHGSIFTSMVLGRYLSQLDVLCGNVTPLIAKYDIDLALTKVYFVFNDIVKQIFMRTDVSRLQSIEILEVSSAFAWSDFARNGSFSVCFTNLTLLRMSFSTSFITNTPSQNYRNVIRVLVPKLEVLIINNCWVAYTGLFRLMSFPNSLRLINARDSADALIFVGSVINFRFIEHVYISESGNVSEDTLYKVTNSVFGKITDYVHSVLEIPNIQYNINLGSISWLVLKSLVLNVIHFVDLVGLISQSPSLKVVNIKLINFSHTTPSGHAFDIFIYVQAVPVTPISAEMEVLNIRQMSPDTPTPFATLCLQHLSVRLPNVKAIGFW